MRRTLAMTVVFLLFSSAAYAGEEARLASGEILVETQDVAGSDIPRVIVKGVIAAPVERVWHEVSNCERYPGTMPNIESAREIERRGDTVVCEVVVSLPFPLSNLTSRTRATHVEGPDRWTRTWTMIEGDWDYKVNDGSWVLTHFQGDSSRTLAVYTIHAEPNTRVPQRLRNRAQRSSMPGAIEALRDALE